MDNQEREQVQQPEEQREQRPQGEQREYRPQGGEQREQRPQYTRMRKKRKVCAFCAEKQQGDIDYKDIARLKKFLSERSKILPRRITGNCAKHQRTLTTAVKRARHIALIPYVSD